MCKLLFSKMLNSEYRLHHVHCLLSEPSFFSMYFHKTVNIWFLFFGQEYIPDIAWHEIWFSLPISDIFLQSAILSRKKLKRDLPFNILRNSYFGQIHIKSRHINFVFVILIFPCPNKTLSQGMIPSSYIQISIDFLTLQMHT